MSLKQFVLIEKHSFFLVTHVSFIDNTEFAAILLISIIDKDYIVLESGD
jgi:hypothetical protein